MPALDDAAAVGAARAFPRLRDRRRRHPLAAQIASRVAAGILTLIVATMLIFGVVQVLPGDAAQVALGRNATPERLKALRADLDLDQPLPVRYWHFAKGVVSGDLGNSTAATASGNTVSVSHLIGKPLVNSLTLAAVTLVLLTPLALLFGAVAALRVGRPTDHVISTSSIVVAVMPEFLLGTILIVVFFTTLDLFPPISQIPDGDAAISHPDALVLPILTLLLVSLGYATRLVRAATIDVLSQNYVAMARINGYRETRVVWRFALRNSIGPSIQVLALISQYFIGGIVIVENVFAYPGIGNALVTAVSARDLQVITVVSTILAALYLTVNIIADIVVTLLVPKLRTAAR